MRCANNGIWNFWHVQQCEIAWEDTFSTSLIIQDLLLLWIKKPTIQVVFRNDLDHPSINCLRYKLPISLLAEFQDVLVVLWWKGKTPKSFEKSASSVDFFLSWKFNTDTWDCRSGCFQKWFARNGLDKHCWEFYQFALLWEKAKALHEMLCIATAALLNKNNVLINLLGMCLLQVEWCWAIKHGHLVTASLRQILILGH